MARGQVGKSDVGLVGSECQLTMFSVSNLLVGFYQSEFFLSFLRESVLRPCKNRSDRSSKSLDGVVHDVRAVRKRGRSTRNTKKDFQTPFRILVISYNRVRKADEKTHH